jgi:phospholipid transport system substrate-binding protein
MRFIRFSSVVVMACAAFAAVAKAESDPQQVLRGAVDEVLGIAYDGKTSAQPLSERVRPVLEKYFNFESITRRAVGPGWRQFKPEQQQRATTLFTELVIRTYADRFEVGERPGITYAAPVELAPGRRELPTTIDYAGKKYAVAYRMELVGGNWRIYDVIIEGVSMIANYRAQFDALSQHGGPDAVIHSLEQNLKQVAAK